MEFKQSAIALFAKYLSEWEANSERMESGYKYELTYAEMMQKVEHEVLQLSVGKVPKSKNFKKNSRPDLER